MAGDFVFINGSLGVILIGMAVSTFFSGSDFLLNEHNFVQWRTPFRGLEALGNIMLYPLGIAMFFLARVGGALYLINNIDDAEIRANARKAALKNTIFFLPFFLIFIAWIFTKAGFAYDESGVVSLVGFKYALNLLQMPLVAAMIVIGVVLSIVFKFAKLANDQKRKLQSLHAKRHGLREPASAFCFGLYFRRLARDGQ